MPKGNYLLALILVLFFVSCNKGLSEEEQQEYKTKGKEIATEVFQTLSSQLSDQIKTGGTVEAIPYCKLTAISLTQQLSEQHKVSIKRTSDQLRNVENQPTAREQAIIVTYKEQLATGEKLIPVVEVDTNGKPHFYAAIQLKKNCLACHGTIGETITQETFNVLSKLYPDDRAIGYKEGDLRGLWSITFNN